MGLGCLPMFLQMPIWVALYAMLYYAIELRHQPAFYGVFQAISGGKWPFLADLAASDHFIPLPESMHVTLPMLGHVTSINLLPVLLGIVFFIQQKYMQAQQTNVDPQVAQQQAIMKWMVLLFPLMLYNSPCGLTLYIFASTSVGIIESKRVRAHLKQLEAEGKLFEKKPNKPGGFMDRLMKAAEERMKQQGGGPGNDGLSGNVRRKPRKD
jgi:YidC/Oxa1 family membrane protein insertase